MYLRRKINENQKLFLVLINIMYTVSCRDIFSVMQ